MEKFKNVKRIYTRPFFVHFKKHFCPSCGERLYAIRESRIATPYSDDYRNFDFYTNENLKVIWTELRCSKCKRNYQINDIRNYERTLKK